MKFMIKWNDHFHVNYVRKVEIIKKHKNSPYGHVEKGDYLTSKQITEDFACQKGETYIVCEERLNKECIYHLVQIQNNAPFVHFTTPRHVGYPWHENNLVAYILENKALLQSVEVL